MWNWLVSALAVGASVVLYDGSPLMPTASVLWNLTDQLGWVRRAGTTATLINVSIHCLFRCLNGRECVKMPIVNIWWALAKWSVLEIKHSSSELLPCTREQSWALKIDADYHVYSKLGSYSAPHVINISDVYSLINVCQREKERGGGDEHR